MPDQPTDSNKNAIKIALGAALGSALGIITAVRTLSGGRQAAGSGQEAVDNEQRAVSGDEVVAHPPSPDAPALHSAPMPPEGHPQHSTGHPDWELLPPAHLPRPTYWPVVLAFGIMLLAWGIVTTFAITMIGLVIFALGLGGWIGDLRHGDG